MSITHGFSRTRLYRIWLGMKNRCYDANRNCYNYYGGRGIKVCDEWKNDFLAFRDWALTHGYSDDLTIDRIDVNGDYEPSNCRWATILEQAQNHSNKVRVMYKGKEYSPAELGKIMGISDRTIYNAHKNKGITDFTHYKPRNKAAVRNVTPLANCFVVYVKHTYIGRFKTIEEAIVARDKAYKKFGITA